MIGDLHCVLKIYGNDQLFYLMFNNYQTIVTLVKVIDVLTNSLEMFSC